MAFQSRTPAIKITVDKMVFNKLVGSLDENYLLGIEENNFSAIAGNLKEKLLRYSVPRVDSDGNEFIDIRFFPNESSRMIEQLLLHLSDLIEDKDYYSILLKNREKNKNFDN